MNIIQYILTKNDCYKANRKIIPKGLMLHSVGCSQPSAMVFIKQWDKPDVAKCVHAFIEPTGDVYQTLPWDHRGWHGASGVKGSVNNTHIGVEMTEPKTIKYVSSFGWIDLSPEDTKKHILGTYKTAVDLFSMLCKEYNLNPLEDGVVISHSEGYKRGIASNHSDVEHIWDKMGLTMNQFRKDVKNKMETGNAVSGIGVDAINYLVEKGRVSNPKEWIDNLAHVKNLEYVFKKWADDVKKIEEVKKVLSE